MHPTHLNVALLDDPAFSPDPRAHPHFPRHHALLYTAPPSATAPPPAKSSVVSKLRRPVPEIPLKPSSTGTVLKPLPTNIPRKAKVKAFVRRLTARHNLDRIDELDETDPFGGSYHHDGPYEAIGNNLAHPPTLASHRGNIHLSKRESVPHPLHASQHQSPYRVPYDKTGLSLHLEPGQILQPDTIYGSHAMTAVSSQLLPQQNAASITTRLDPSRRRSLPNPRTRPHQDTSSVDPQRGFQDRHSSSLRAPRERYPRDCSSDIPDNPPRHHDYDAASHAHHQTQKTLSPPPRYESRLHTSGTSRSPERIPLPSSDPVSPKTPPTKNVAPASSRHDTRHKVVNSLNDSHTIDSTSTRSSSSIRNKPLDLPRTRHLPKRLVMPALLQPQTLQPHYTFPSAEPPSRHDEYTVGCVLESARFEGQPGSYNQDPRTARNKLSAFSAKTLVADHALVSRDDAVPVIRICPTKTANEIEATKERTRRRKLSKRKNDI